MSIFVHYFFKSKQDLLEFLNQSLTGDPVVVHHGEGFFGEYWDACLEYPDPGDPEELANLGLSDYFKAREYESFIEVELGDPWYVVGIQESWDLRSDDLWDLLEDDED